MTVPFAGEVALWIHSEGDPGDDDTADDDSGEADDDSGEADDDSGEADDDDDTDPDSGEDDDGNGTDCTCSSTAIVGPIEALVLFLLISLISTRRFRSSR